MPAPGSAAPLTETSEAYRLCRSVRFRTVDGQAVVLHQDRGEVLVLSDVANDILSLIQKGTPPREWAPALLGSYGVEEDVLRSDITEFLDVLRTAGVVESIPISTPSRP
ncbi:PqqD family protein [bacterium]|nr:MAG: PqqD family protein [bacterium]